jgi:hypothetical protein
VQPHMDFRTAGQRDLTRTVSILALVIAGGVMLGWFLPYISVAGFEVSLSDGDGNFDLAVLGPSLLAIAGAVVGLTGQQRGTALAIGAAAGVATMCLVFVATVYETVSGADDIEGIFESRTDYGIGFYLHAVVAMVAIVGAFIVFSLFTEAARHEEKTVAPPLALLGGAGIAASGLGMLLPDDGFSIFDIPSTPIKTAYLTFIAAFTLVGVVGFAFRHATGAAAGVGAASTPLLMWLADAMESRDSGDTFIGGLSDGNTALVAVGAITATIVGVVGIMSGARARRAVRAPAPEPFGGWSPPAPWMPDLEPARPPVRHEPIEPVAAVPPAGWHPDPLGRHEQRYWDGAEWTAHVADQGLPGSDPL